MSTIDQLQEDLDAVNAEGQSQMRKYDRTADGTREHQEAREALGKISDRRYALEQQMSDAVDALEQS